MGPAYNYSITRRGCHSGTFDLFTFDLFTVAAPYHLMRCITTPLTSDPAWSGGKHLISLPLELTHFHLAAHRYNTMKWIDEIFELLSVDLGWDGDYTLSGSGRREGREGVVWGVIIKEGGEAGSCWMITHCLAVEDWGKGLGLWGFIIKEGGGSSLLI